MSKSFSPKGGIPPALKETLSPLFYLLGKLEEKLNEEDHQQLIDDLVQSFPQTPHPEPCLGRGNPLFHNDPDLPVSTIQTEENASVVYSGGNSSTSGSSSGNSPDFPDFSNFPGGTIRLGADNTGASFFHFKEAFAALEEYYPLRAAAYYLRCLVRVWVGLVEDNKFDVMTDDDFLMVYLDAMLQVESIASRCACCAQKEEVTLQ